MLYRLVPTLILSLGLYFALNTVYNIYNSGVTSTRLLMILLSIVLVVRGIWLLRSPVR